MKDVNAWHYHRYAEEKEAIEKRDIFSVMAARETNTIPARYLGR